MIVNNINWIPVKFAVPAKNGRYLVTKVWLGESSIDIIGFAEGKWCTGCNIKAWSSMPIPYGKEKENG